jgi:hypothetical protein
MRVGGDETVGVAELQRFCPQEGQDNHINPSKSRLMSVFAYGAWEACSRFRIVDIMVNM